VRSIGGAVVGEKGSERVGEEQRNTEREREDVKEKEKRN